MRAFSETQLRVWGTVLAVDAGLVEPGADAGLLVLWQHDEWCALHPSAPRRPTASSRCDCGPDATAIVTPGDGDERRVPLVVEGRAVPVAPEARGGGRRIDGDAVVVTVWGGG
jgi:hypothetical protein